MAKRPISRVRDILRLLVFLALVAVGAAYLGGLTSEEFQGQVFVLDGDSLRVGEREVRLRGIDAPERGQICRNRLGEDYDCGERARLELRQLTADIEVTCTSSQFDRFGRTLAVCYGLDTNKSINEIMVQRGWAVDYGDFPLVEQRARNRKQGLWAGTFESPRVFRSKRGGVAQPTWISPIFNRGGDDG